MCIGPSNLLIVYEIHKFFIFICYTTYVLMKQKSITMKSKIWIITILVSVFVIGGCSENNSDDNKNHTNINHEGAEMEMENDLISHNNPLKLNDSIG